MSLLPKDEKFYDMLVEQTKIAAEAAALLAASDENSGATANGAGARATAEKIRHLEQRGDTQLHVINHRLHKTFITPIDPEDIHALASGVDEILDHIEAAAYRIDAFGLEPPPPRLRELAGMVNACVQHVLRAMETLQRKGIQKPEEMTLLCEAINKQETATENAVRQAMRELFANERDPIELIKKKEIYELLERAADCCEDVADTLDAIGVKNS